MVLYTFRKKMSCDEADKCSLKIRSKLKQKFNKLIKEKDKHNFSLTILHEPNNHLIHLFLCDKDGIVDTPNKHTPKQKSNRAVKITGKIPTKEEIIKAL